MASIYFAKTKSVGVRSEEFIKKILIEHYAFSCDQIVLNTDEYGKPFILDCPDVHFNVSHTKGLIVCAVSDRTIGVDVERLRKYDPRIVKSYFTPSEQEYISMKAESLDKGFIEIWTMKEAYLKWLGRGIELPPVLFEVLQIDNIIRVWMNQHCIAICADNLKMSDVSFKKSKYSMN